MIICLKYSVGWRVLNAPQLGRFGLRLLRITASSAALVELLRQEWIAAAIMTVAWILSIQAERSIKADQ